MDLKDLQKLIQLCRKSGVLSIKMEGVELTLSEDAPAAAKPRGKAAVKAKATASPDHDKTELEGEMSPEALLFWSSNYTSDEDKAET